MQSKTKAPFFGALEGEDEIIVSTDPAPEQLYDGYAVVTVTDGVIEDLPARANAVAEVNHVSVVSQSDIQ
jgi:hypothetical protein